MAGGAAARRRLPDCRRRRWARRRPGSRRPRRRSRPQALAWLEKTKPDAGGPGEGRRALGEPARDPSPATNCSTAWPRRSPWPTPSAAKLVGTLLEAAQPARAARASPGCTTRNCRRLVDRQSPPVLRPLAGAGSRCSTRPWSNWPGLKPGDVVAPAELLFYQGVVYHRLLNQEEGLEGDRRAAGRAEASPRRYVAVARLMQADLEHAEARHAGPHRPADGGHRSAAGPGPRRAQGPQGRGRRDRVARQDHQEARGRAAAAAAGDSGGNELQPSKPADDSRPMGGKGPGRGDQAEHRQQERLGRPAAEGARRGHAADRPRFSLPLPRRHRAILPQAGHGRE